MTNGICLHSLNLLFSLYPLSANGYVFIIITLLLINSHFNPPCFIFKKKIVIYLMNNYFEAVASKGVVSVCLLCLHCRTFVIQ